MQYLIYQPSAINYYITFSITKLNFIKYIDNPLNKLIIR